MLQKIGYFILDLGPIVKRKPGPQRERFGKYRFQTMGGTGLEHHADLPRDSGNWTRPAGHRTAHFLTILICKPWSMPWPALSEGTRGAIVILATGGKSLH